jgi:hypothetical protein
VEVPGIRRLKVFFHDRGTMGNAKPRGTNGAIIAFAVLDAPPDDTEVLIRNVLATRTPYTLEFTEVERGKTVYLALRWQNKKGQCGPWSEIKNAIIP